MHYEQLQEWDLLLRWRYVWVVEAWLQHARTWSRGRCLFNVILSKWNSNSAKLGCEDFVPLWQNDSGRRRGFHPKVQSQLTDALGHWTSADSCCSHDSWPCPHRVVCTIVCYIHIIYSTYILEVRQFCFPTSLHLKRSVTERCLPTGSAWFCFNKFCSSNTPTLGFGLSLVSLIMSCSWTIINQIYLTHFLYCLISCHVIMINYIIVSSLLQQIKKYKNDIKWLSRLHPTAMICCHWN